jgi:hypothetical protein
LDAAQVIKGGRHTRLTFRNRHEYIRAAVETRAQECRAQVEAVLEGLSAIVPLPLLKLFSAAELKVLVPPSSPNKTLCQKPPPLQHLVCGAETFDLELLKRYTNLDSLQIRQHADWVKPPNQAFVLARSLLAALSIVAC